MSGVPSSDEILVQLTELVTSGFNASARQKASAWATPILIDNPMLELFKPEYNGIFLLGAADIIADPKEPGSYLYGPSDFESAIRQLTDQDSARG